MLFRLDDVHKSYGAHDVLNGVTFQVNPADRVGLVGRNGAGKTTVFRLLTGIEHADRGEVILLRGLRAGLLDQQPVFEGDGSVLDEALSVFTNLKSMEKEMLRLEHVMSEASGESLDEAMHAYSDLRHRYESDGGFTYQPRAESVLAGLGFKREDLERPAEQLSGGQKARLALSKLLLAEPDLLLLDEPTNHLDVDAVEWLEDFLSDYKKAFVIISHDRFLLDRTVTKIIEIAGGAAAVYAGNYSAYTKQREERRLAQMRQYEQQQELIERTEEFIRRNIAGQKTKQAKSRRNKLERMDRLEAVNVDETGGNFQLRGVVRAGDQVLYIDDLSIGYSSAAPLAGSISFMLRRGERIGIIGPNGSGKSTFLKTIIGDLEPLSGGFLWGAKVDFGYFDQELGSLNKSAIVLEEIMAVAPNVAAGELRGYLARFLFSGDDVFKPVGALSGGEQSRLALAKLIYSGVNVLILDEPTNHLDIQSREALEQALAEYAGTIITVSHDRYFLDKIATEILHFEAGTASYHMGTYSDYYAVHHRKQSQIEEPAPKRVQSAGAGKKPAAAKPERKKRSAEKIEEEIHLLEGEMAALSERLSKPSLEWGPADYEEIGQRQTEISTQLEQLYSEWESLGGT